MILHPNTALSLLLWLVLCSGVGNSQQHKVEYSCSPTTYDEALHTVLDQSGRGQLLADLMIETTWQPEARVQFVQTEAGISVNYVRFRSAMWPKLSHFTTPPTREECIQRAKAEVESSVLAISTRQMNQLLSQLAAIDFKASDECMRNPAGRCVGLNDGTIYELLVPSRNVQLRFHETRGTGYLSENPAALTWVHAVLADVPSASSVHDTLGESK